MDFLHLFAAWKHFLAVSAYKLDMVLGWGMCLHVR